MVPVGRAADAGAPEVIHHRVARRAAALLGIGFDFHPFTDGPIDWRIAAPIALLLVLTGFCLLPVAVKLLHPAYAQQPEALAEN